MFATHLFGHRKECIPSTNISRRFSLMPFSTKIAQRKKFPKVSPQNTKRLEITKSGIMWNDRTNIRNKELFYGIA